MLTVYRKKVIFLIYNKIQLKCCILNFVIQDAVEDKEMPTTIGPKTRCTQTQVKII